MRFPRVACAAAGLVGLTAFFGTSLAAVGGATTPRPPSAISAPAATQDPQSLGVAGDPTAEGVFWIYVNNVRASLGTAPLRYDARLQVYAQQQAQAMAATGQLFHCNLAPLLGTWSAAAENVGYGPSADAINQSLSASPTHYQNLTSPTYNAIGVGVAYDASGRMWTSHLFAS
jgi:uncharacterized protein YkwD